MIERKDTEKEKEYLKKVQITKYVGCTTVLEIYIYICTIVWNLRSKNLSSLKK